MHLAVKTGVKPIDQTLLRGTQIHIRDTNLGKSKQKRLRFHGVQQLCFVDHLRLIHLSILETRQVTWPDEEATSASAQRLANLGALKNAVIALHGELGAGKTTFARHLLRALGVVGTIKSPSYSVMEVYDLAEMRACHFDFYRFDDPQEWEDAGFREVFADPGLKLVEWPDKALGLMPQPDLSVTISALASGNNSESRHVVFDAHSTIGQALLP